MTPVSEVGGRGDSGDKEELSQLSNDLGGSVTHSPLPHPGSDPELRAPGMPTLLGFKATI